MKDEEIISRLRAAAPGSSATALAELLDRLTGGRLAQDTLIVYFQRAFPQIPLRVLLDTGSWHRVTGGPMTDAELNALMGPWLP